MTDEKKPDAISCEMINNHECISHDSHDENAETIPEHYVYEEIPRAHARFYLNAELQVEFTCAEGKYEGGVVCEKTIFSSLPSRPHKLFNGVNCGELFNTKPELFDYLMKGCTKTRVNKLMNMSIAQVKDMQGFNPIVRWVSHIIQNTAYDNPDDLCHFIRRETICDRLQYTIANTISYKLQLSNDYYIYHDFDVLFRKLSLVAVEYVMKGKQIPFELMMEIEKLFKNAYSYNVSSIDDTTIDWASIPESAYTDYMQSGFLYTAFSAPDPPPVKKLAFKQI